MYRKPFSSAYQDGRRVYLALRDRFTVQEIRKRNPYKRRKRGFGKAWYNAWKEGVDDTWATDEEK